jgi:hypothetical protein
MMFGRDAVTPADLRFGVSTDDIFGEANPDLAFVAVTNADNDESLPKYRVVFQRSSIWKTTTNAWGKACTDSQYPLDMADRSLIAELINKFKINILYILMTSTKNVALPPLVEVPNAQYHRLRRSITLVDSNGVRSRCSVHVYHPGLVGSIAGQRTFYLDEGGRLMRDSQVLIDPYKWRELSFTPLWKSTIAASYIDVDATVSYGTNRHPAEICFTDAEEEAYRQALSDHRLVAKDYSVQLPARLQLARLHIQRHLAKLSHANEESNALPRHEFDIGDLVWLSSPMKSEIKRWKPDANNPATQQQKKFMFRWIGPVRVVGRSLNKNNYSLVEVLPDGRLLPRLANACRLRPYVPAIPLDSAEAAAMDAVGKDNFDEEVERWRDLRIVKRRPKMEMAPGVNRELFIRFDPDAAYVDPDDPEFFIEKLRDHSLDETDPENRYYKYRVKWLGQGTCRDTWIGEHHIPALIIEDYWEGLRLQRPRALHERVLFLRTDKDYLKRIARERKALDKEARASAHYIPPPDDDAVLSDLPPPQPIPFSDIRETPSTLPAPAVNLDGAVTPDDATSITAPPSNAGAVSEAPTSVSGQRPSSSSSPSSI